MVLSIEPLSQTIPPPQFWGALLTPLPPVESPTAHVGWIGGMGKEASGRGEGRCAGSRHDARQRGDGAKQVIGRQGADEEQGEGCIANRAASMGERGTRAVIREVSEGGGGLKGGGRGGGLKGGRGSEGGRKGGSGEVPPPPPTVYGRSNTSLVVTHKGREARGHTPTSLKMQ